MTHEPKTPHETVTVEFKVALGEGHFSASATVPAGKTNLTEILPVLRALDDSLISGVSAELGEAGYAISCRRGCSECCSQLVPMSIFEAESIAEHLRSLPEERQKELAERFHQALSKLSAAGLIDRMVAEGLQADSKEFQQLVFDYFYQRIPCPFLEDHACSIYPVRPFACREYLVTSPAEYCFDPVTMPVVGVKRPLKFFALLNQIGAEVEHGSRGWIPLLFLFAWMKSGARPGQAISADGPQVLYEVLRRIGEQAEQDADAEPED
jgi:Fe-S-cluster containining protein